MGIYETDAIPCQAINIWGLHSRCTITGQIAESQIVCVNKHDIRFGDLLRKAGRRHKPQRKSGKYFVHNISQILNIDANLQLVIDLSLH
jgi:hypothetical protein